MASDHKEWYSVTEIADMKGMTRANVHLIIKKKCDPKKLMKLPGRTAAVLVNKSELHNFD